MPRLKLFHYFAPIICGPTSGRSSDNAVKTQIWIAISVYVLVAIVMKRLGIEQDLYTILQILSVTLFEKTELEQALSDGYAPLAEGQSHNQLLLFAF